MFLSKPMLGTQLDHSDSLNNPVLDLLFNEGYGDRVNDLSGWGNHGVLHGFDFPATHTSGWNPGLDGVCLAFDGSNDYISVPNSSSLNFGSNDDFYLFALVKMRIDATTSFVFKGDIGANEQWYGIRWNSGPSAWEASIDDGTTRVDSDKAATFDTNWHRIGGAFDRDGDVTVFVDGVAGVPSSIAAVGDIDNAGTDLWIGLSQNVGTRGYYMNGTIARTRILPRCPSAFEVMQTQINPYAGYLQ